MAQVQWSDLPVEILHIIFYKLKDPSDIYRCGLVCVLWTSVAKTVLPHCVLLSNVDVFKDETGRSHSKASLNKQSCILLGAFGTRDGAGQDGTTWDNLFLSHVWRYLSMGYDGIRPGDESWTRVQFCDSFDCFCSDAIFCKDKFYAVGYCGNLFRISCNIIPIAAKLPLQPIRLANENQLTKFNYLVELDGNLLLVARYGNHISKYVTFVFEVYELNWVEKQWIKVKVSAIMPFYWE
ncbi:hypothetical protein Ddye_028695 [Dipteronia dyeriana]|uniref:F-box domain-containing protein n=1 Tax=Dipteronia dyeriana TaxID=168575 RepID=A0AAD9WL26_9ROSI|nr:hypothetical protein Ddye_028695 [Dipteronia dyeriana]